MSTETWSVHIDGASRGNPGDAAYALVIERPGHPPWEEADRLGRTTNNIAEYTALVRALERCAQLGGKRLLIHSDSELLVKQMNGDYKVKNADLKELNEEARGLLSHFEKVTLRHVYREQNAVADALCNAALDGRPRRPPSFGSNQPPVPSLRDQAIAQLEAAAQSWADGEPNAPTPEQVWDKLWAMISATKAPK